MNLLSAAQPREPTGSLLFPVTRIMQPRLAYRHIHTSVFAQLKITSPIFFQL